MNMPAGEFKAKCLKLMNEVRQGRESITITKRGTPVAKLVPVEEKESRSLFGFLKDSVIIRGDIVSSTGEKWDADE